MPCDAQTIIDDATCVECFVPPGMQPAALLVILCAIRDGDTSMSCDPQAIIDEAECLQCKIPPGMMGAAILSVACAIAQAGGGGGGGGATQVFSGHYAGGDPGFVPTTSAAIAYDLDAPFQEWKWDGTDWT